ncbi:DUF4935 domain-containing protein [Sulfurimonas sp. SAG-AH-194-C21]|nr:PIN domain-containing protein [Sulfurimonas sp. SAG-AH-194-C21]MDF1882900.1 DUF4935 domain-containing protein [Sulfurimonas sp. SAG-AH-194-C21]
MQKVIFDTNAIRNVDVKQYFGGRLELEKFYKVAELIFPDIVIEEMRNQKKRKLQKNKDAFLSNPFHAIQKLNEDDIKDFDIEGHIDFLECKETLKYTQITLSDYSILGKMKDLALKKLPPFESGDSTDKGFKDAYIYFTILEYVQSLTEKNVFICTNDGKLKEALQHESSITIIKDYDDFKKHNINQYKESYFLEKISEELQLDNITKNSIVDYWINNIENAIILLKIDIEKYVIEVDSGEIIAFTNISNYRTSFNNLIKSDNIELTKSTIEELSNYINFLSNDEIVKIFNVLKENEQISLALSEENVRQFISTLYDDFEDTIPLDLKLSIKRMLD